MHCDLNGKSAFPSKCSSKHIAYLTLDDSPIIRIDRELCDKIFKHATLTVMLRVPKATDSVKA